LLKFLLSLLPLLPGYNDETLKSLLFGVVLDEFGRNKIVELVDRLLCLFFCKVLDESVSFILLRSFVCREVYLVDVSGFVENFGQNLKCD
jgi:hypothetical protein